MRIAVIALGSRGDVQPYVALGKGLQEAGHAVRLVTHDNFERLVDSHGLSFWRVRGNVQDVAKSPEMRDLLEKGNFLAITAKMAKEATREAPHWAEDGLAACRGTDLIVAGIGGLFLALSLAEKLEIPLLQAHLVPFTPTRAFPSVLFPGPLSRLGGFAKYVSHHLTRQMMWQGSRRADKVSRQVLGIAPASFWGPYRAGRLGELPVLYGFSPSVIPKPSDWGEDIHVTGYWFLDEGAEWAPPSELMAFLQSGPPPVYVGFGSMSLRKPEETVNVVVQALARAEQRAVLLSGWAGLRPQSLPDTVFVVDAVPHAWLFPRVAAVVHHGGAGTTAAGLRAGVPSIVIPFFGDQPFWGQRTADLGVGPEAIRHKALTAARLGQAIRQVIMDEGLRQRAAQLGRKIRAEDGVGRAVEVIDAIESKEKVN